MTKHPSAFINTIAEGRNFNEAITRICRKRGMNSKT